MTEWRVVTHTDEDRRYASRPEENPRCDDCKAGKLGDRFTLAIIEGGPCFTCTVCGYHPRWLDELDREQFEMEDIPVTLAVEHQCDNPGGWHGMARCDCNWWIAITPRE